MKVLQIIDSLDAGGAERMAVNIANALQKSGNESHLCTTRKEGLLKEAIEEEVNYLFLEKKGKLGLAAIFKLNNYIRVHQIDVIHAHSTSAFTAVMAFLFLKKKTKLIWHDHYGKANELALRPKRLLKILSRYFDQIISVNQLLEKWAVTELKCKQVFYLENFAVSNQQNELVTPIQGVEGKRIVCLANLREQKDHLNLIHAFEKLQLEFPEWTLHLCGQDFNDQYSSKLKLEIKNKQLQDRVFLLGSRSDVFAVLKSCDIGVLPSKSEGLPVALLEYGLAQLPVIVTDVGACKEVVIDKGIVVPSGNSEILSKALLKLMAAQDLRTDYAIKFHDHVTAHYGSEKYVEKLLSVYNPD